MMAWILSHRDWLWVAALVVVLLAFGKAKIDLANAVAREAQTVAAMERASRAAHEAARLRESEMQEAANVEAEKMAAKMEQLRAAAADLDRDNERLRIAARNYARRAVSKNTGTARAGEARQSAADLLADMFGRANEVAGKLAHALDEARLKGLACERMYEQIRGAE